jgi:methylthioribose-1-phosphate isomerase
MRATFQRNKQLNDVEQGEENPGRGSTRNLRRRQRCEPRESGHHGEPLIPDGATVLTHCNAGALATAGDYGTALGVIARRA